MYILGINTGRNTSAALIKDGEIIAMAEEERFIREKGTSKFPLNAIKFCLEFEKITLDSVDYIVFPYDLKIGIWKLFKVFIRYFPKSLQALFVRFQKMLTPENFVSLLSKNFGLSKKEIKKRLYKIEHHIAHSAVAYFASGFKSAAILSIDGSGEVATTLLAKAKDNRIVKLKEVYFPNSVGLLYNTITQFLGFKIDDGEGKVMGLAPYGKPNYTKEFEDIIWPTDDGGYKMNMKYFRYHYTANKKQPFYSKKFIKRFGKPRIRESEITERDKDLAATLQDVTEKIGVHLAKHLYEITKEKNLCIGGGVALNSVMNFKILENVPFENIYIYPASHDGGTAIGAALYLYYCVLKNPKKPVTQSPYLGPSYTNDEIKKALEKFNLKYRKVENDEEVAKIGAKFISEGKIIGWFQGRLEIGPRALGNRSILCAPYPAEMKDILNERVKHREGFRPFAPSVKIERYKDYFEIETPSPYMLLVCKVKKEKIKEVPAITHVDETARLQTVSKEENPLYWKLIDYYEKLTGCPVILNTSFNVRGEPIVCSPEDAIKCFLGTHMDALIIGNYIVEK